MTEIYTKELLHSLSGNEIVSVLSCFHEERETEECHYLSDLNVSQAVYDVLQKVQTLSQDFKDIEIKIGHVVDGYWNLSTQMIMPMTEWIEGKDVSQICTEYGLFEGNFIRTIMKTSNMLDELLSMATYCQHIEVVDKIIEVRQRMIRDIVIPDSLYLRL
jgi:superfamily II RNA helicase